MNPVCILRISVRSDSARRWFQKEVRNSVFLYLGPFPAKRVQSFCFCGVWYWHGIEISFFWRIQKCKFKVLHCSLEFVNTCLDCIQHYISLIKGGGRFFNVLYFVMHRYKHTPLCHLARGVHSTIIPFNLSKW